MKQTTSFVSLRVINWVLLVAGVAAGGIGAMILTIFVGMPIAIGHRSNLPLEKLYGDFAVGLAARTQAGTAQNPLAQNPRANESGRTAYTGSCSVCHGVGGDGKGEFGQAIYPPATDLRTKDSQEKSDAELYWIIKNGLSFAGMPGFGNQYSDQEIWALVSYTRSLGNASGSSSSLIVLPPTIDQLSVANPNGDSAQRGAAVYFAQGCDVCHGAVGNAPGELRLRGGGREVSQTLRRGRPGMPVYGQTQITDLQMADLAAYMISMSAR